MSENGTGNPEVIEFEDLEGAGAGEGEGTPSREEQLAVFLKDKLSEEDFGSAAKILGVETSDLSNAELLEKLTALLQGKAEPEKEDPEEKEMADYKTFIKDCMAEGKTMEDCQAEYKEKYPEGEPKKEGEAEAALSEPKDEKYAELNNRIAELEGKLQLEEISNEVTGLVQAKHLSPRQVEPVVKLGAGMTPEMRAEFFNLFKGQKYTVSDDKGLALSKRPGEPEAIDEETRARILKEQGISDLISEKAVRRNN